MTFKIGDRVSTTLFRKTHVGTITNLFDDDTCIIEADEEFLHHYLRRPIRKLRVWLSDVSHIQ